MVCVPNSDARQGDERPRLGKRLRAPNFWRDKRSGFRLAHACPGGRGDGAGGGGGVARRGGGRAQGQARRSATRTRGGEGGSPWRATGQNLPCRGRGRRACRASAAG